MPQNKLLLLRFCLIHTKATVLNRNPHDSMTDHTSLSMGSVTHRNNAQSWSAKFCTGRAHNSFMLIVG